jgi:hypothetical protein
VISSVLLAGYTKEIATMALDQSALTDLLEALCADHFAWFVLEAVAGLDLSSLFRLIAVTVEAVPPAAAGAMSWRLSARSSRGADHLGRLQFDQLLQHELHGLVARANDQYDPARRP